MPKRNNSTFYIFSLCFDLIIKIWKFLIIYTRQSQDITKNDEIYKLKNDHPVTYNLTSKINNDNLHWLAQFVFYTTVLTLFILEKTYYKGENNDY